MQLFAHSHTVAGEAGRGVTYVFVQYQEQVVQVHSPVRWPEAAAGAVRADSPCCCLLSVLRAGNRRKLAPIFCGLQEAIKRKLRLPGRAARSTAASCTTELGRSAPDQQPHGAVAVRHRAAPVLLPGRQPGSQHRALGPTKACPVFGEACNSYSDKEHNTEKYGDQDHDISQ